MRNRFREGDVLEILSPSGTFGKSVRVADMQDEAGQPCPDASFVQGIYSFPCPYPLAEGDLFRRRRA